MTSDIVRRYPWQFLAIAWLVFAGNTVASTYTLIVTPVTILAPLFVLAHLVGTGIALFALAVTTAIGRWDTTTLPELTTVNDRYVAV